MQKASKVNFAIEPTVLRQSFPAAQKSEFLTIQRVKWMHYSEQLQPFLTTVCSAQPSLLLSASETWKNGWRSVAYR